MNTHFKKQVNGITSFLKRYGYYVILGVTLCALAVTILLIVPTNDNLDVGGDVIVFADPVLNASVLKGYSGTELQYNATLNKWEAHKAIDFLAPSGTNVFAVYGGTVQSVYTNYMEGTVIVLDHGGGLRTVYKSLDSEVSVEQGGSVEKGQVIGVVSDSATSESADGAHIHFEVWKDGTKIDPSAYLTMEDK